MTDIRRNRVQAGVPTGGEFATGARNENDDLPTTPARSMSSRMDSPDEHMTEWEVLEFGDKAVAEKKDLLKAKACGPTLTAITNEKLTVISAKRVAVLAQFAWPTVTEIAVDDIDGQLVVTSLKMEDGNRLFWTWAPKSFNALNRQIKGADFNQMVGGGKVRPNGSGQWILDAEACLYLQPEDVDAVDAKYPSN